MTKHRESAVALTIRPDRNGQMWVTVDCLVDMFADMGVGMVDGPAKNTLATLESTFRKVSTYHDMDEAVSGDGGQMQAYRCARCDAVVIDGKRIGGDSVVIDAEPVPNGELFPLRIDAGVPTMAPWRPGLDGVTDTRLTEHFCQVP